MRILLTGAAGMIASKLLLRLVRDGGINGRPISHATLHDTILPAAPAGTPFPVTTQAGDISAPGASATLLAERPDLIFHMAAVVSGEAETDLEKGYQVNLDGTRNLYDEILRIGAGYRPRVVFASSIAVFGAPFPEQIGDDFIISPLTSYGTQKAIGELFLNDYSRRGIFDGVGIRLPTISVRPGQPNRAASGFFSSIIREPLAGREAILPVDLSVRHWHASPRSAVGFFLHAATMDTALLGARRCLSMPGLSVTVAGQIDALRRVAGDKAVRLIRSVPDPSIMAIVAGWPRDFDTNRARSLGFSAETDYEQIVRVHIEDELGGRLT